MKKLIRSTALISMLVILATPVRAADKMQIAVIDLQPRGVSKVLAGAVTDIIRSEMVRTGLFTVVERGQMNEILKEQGFQMTGCTDSACAVQVGKLLSAKKILMGEMNKIGQAFMITVRIVDVEKGAAEFAASEKAENEDMLDRTGSALTRKLAENIREGNKDFFVEKKSKSGYYLRSIVPGWGQVYAGHPVKGYIFMGTFIAAAGITGYFTYDYLAKRDDYDSVPRGAPKSEFNDKFDTAQKAGNIALISLCVTGAVYLAHWVDALFFTSLQTEDVRADASMDGPSRFTLDIRQYRDPLLKNERRVDAGLVWRF